MFCGHHQQAASVLVAHVNGGTGLPQPNRGVPGTGALTLMFLGEAGVAGLADILCIASASAS